MPRTSRSLKGDASRRQAFFAMAGLAGLPMLAAPGKLPNSTRSLPDAKVTKEAFGEVNVYYDGPTDQLKAMTAGSLRLHPGAEPHPPHQHPEEEILVVTEGSGEIVVEGKTTAAVPGTMMYCAANKLHGIKNTGKKPLLFYYFKWQA